MFHPSFYDGVTQASFFSARLQAIDKRATKDNASVSIMALHAQVLSVLEVSCAVKKAGEGFAVFLMVVVKSIFGGLVRAFALAIMRFLLLKARWSFGIGWPSLTKIARSLSLEGNN